MNSISTIEKLKNQTNVLYEIAGYICEQGFELDSLATDLNFAGGFSLYFHLTTNDSPPWTRRSFRLSRDPRDTLVELFELLPTPQNPNQNEYTLLAHENFQEAEDWSTVISQAGKKLLQEIKK